VHDQWYERTRLIGLSRFAAAITILNILGHLVLGFEQSWITPFLAVGTCYLVDLAGESAESLAEGRAPAWIRDGQFRLRQLTVFLLPAHITGLAVGMLLYAAHQLWAIVFACAAAIASKYIVRLRRLPATPGLPPYVHFLNPSNFGIAATLVLFPMVGIAPPYQFSENTSEVFDWLLPLIVIGTGSYLNIRATRRHVLIAAWVIAFFGQAALRSLIHGAPLVASAGPMTGFAFILFTFYMITDPGTTPSKPRQQVLFAVSVALVYAVLVELHVVFDLFFALAIVAGARALIAFWRRIGVVRRNLG
jgi:hypothetical protein